MSNSVSLDISLTSKNNCFIEDIIRTLLNNDWYIVKNKQTTYLPIGDNDMYDWTSKEVTEQELFNIIKIKEDQNEIIGLELYYLNSEIGFHLLIFNTKELTLMIDINKKYINKEMGILDFNWYIEKIIPCLHEKFNVSEYKFDFIY